MVSSTQQTSRIRRRKARRTTASVRFNRAHGTPAFPIQPEGYDPKAADAKPVAEAAPAQPAKTKPAKAATKK
ncbi:MAG TPA: hypothetical protein VL400_01030 [Polyangiaceae bacterium]|jgi:hypothetical protein|nr:hypothetical protein [Polyangiaceae bacterium]